MRFLGNKTSILSEIEDLLREKDLLNKGLSFFDAFCGTGSVADYFKKHYNIIINDNLTWAVMYAKGRICAQTCSFKNLGFDPFEYFNTGDKTLKGFMYNNYSPGNSKRMYFTPENAGRIDFFRWQIEEWKNNQLITDNEYSYLMACLIESVSSVSNTAGVYGAFLKKWDPRALKPIIFSKVDSADAVFKSLKEYNAKTEDIIENVDCDILYIDPPYTQNQYGTQYHLLETLVLDDNPSISPVTGSRKTAPMRSDWSKDIKSHILFDKIVAKTKAKYILFSYNKNGFMSQKFIESVLKRYGKADTYVCKKIPYKKYQNWKSAKDDEHFEYLFFIEKKEDEEVVYESPLNYIGNKVKVVPDIKKYVPQGHKAFYDVFGGGFNVGINMSNLKVVYVDINHYVTELIESFSKYDTYEYIMYMRKMIKSFGLKKGDAESYLKIREYYNSLDLDKRDPRLLFTMILYGFQQQIRFNNSHNFNNPVGVRWFNDRILEKMVSFSRRIKEREYIFLSDSYLNVENELDSSTFVYMDPPYQLTNGSYNDGKRGFKGWNVELEGELFSFADRLNKRNISFMISYVVEHKGQVNQNLLAWVKQNGYKIIELGKIMGISGSRRKEVLIINYEI